MREYYDIMSGDSESDCLEPCTQTKIATAFLTDKVIDHHNRSKIDITFSKMVSISRTDFPKFNLAAFVSSIGGSMGFWLGLSVIQAMNLSITLLCQGSFSKET